MRKTACFYLCFAMCLQFTTAQKTDLKTIYRASAERKFNLSHVKMDVKFDYAKKYLYGKVWLNLKPHFYKQNMLKLDAKNMFINSVSLLQGTKNIPLVYDYADSLALYIKLNKTYSANEKFTIYIDYTARPDDIVHKGSAAIRDAKGLYFINADGKNPNKPIQIWTQGETAATSVWVPIIDETNQKTTQETIMTVPAKYITLSNGLLKSQKKNADSTRTDTWLMDQPHSPYLFFMGVGDYTIIKDKYKNIAVDYYVEPKYASVAKRIFGLTPEMMGFYSKLLGVEYPWKKYAQIVGQDYVSGAMENTTATLHGAGAYQNNRQLYDGNDWETTVAHELFHQWFGDLVTAESWSNITLNESFADYSEYLWLDYKYGKDDADYEWLIGANRYINSATASAKHLARFNYENQEDVFDVVSYQKGGRILHMLRNYLGDSAFFKGLNLYLNQNKFKNGEIHQLRLAMEEISGRDLNWFFNQWYFNNGHPIVSINYEKIDSTNSYKISFNQKQDKPFKLPVDIDIYYTDGSKERKNIWIENTQDSLVIELNKNIDFVNVDADKILLWKKEDNKTEDQFIKQFMYATNYIDKNEAINYINKNYKGQPAMKEIMHAALSDKFYIVRTSALRFFAKHVKDLDARSESKIASMAATIKENGIVKATATDVLSKTRKTQYNTIFEQQLSDSSYATAGAALEALIYTKPQKALAMYDELKKDAKVRLEQSLRIVEYIKKDVSEADSVIAKYKKLNNFEKPQHLKGMLQYSKKIADTVTYKKLLGPVLEAATRITPGLATLSITQIDIINDFVTNEENKLKLEPENEILKLQINYIKEKLTPANK